jgi:hypothetical protein
LGWPRNQSHGGGIDVHVGELNVSKFGAHAIYNFPP